LIELLFSFNQVVNKEAIFNTVASAATTAGADASA
jgi:hypothetical protein